jgi:glycosyltransferase involved in cell wall biosynthesis
LDIQSYISKKVDEKGSLISIVLPLYNEQESLPAVLKELTDYLPKFLSEYNFEITFIDDCSKDDSYNIVKKFANSNSCSNVKFTIFQLAKNSGSHIAITAGLNISRGDFTIVMASDGQDPIEIVSQLINEWTNGNDLVLASRLDNLDQHRFSKSTSRLAWKLMSWATKIDIPETGCDLLGMDKIVLNSFNQMNERNTTFIFRIFSLGFKRKEIQYIKRARFGGKSNWTFWKKISIMIDAITGFSNRPLKIITNFGLLVSLILFLRWVFLVANIFILKKQPSELTIILNTIFTGLAIQMVVIGFIGDYIWRILDETRKRPIYSFRKCDGKIFENE